MLSHPRTKLSQSKQLIRNKATSHFLKELNWKSEDDFGHSIGDKYTRSSKMKSTFQREKTAKIVFESKKERRKYQIFRQIH